MMDNLISYFGFSRTPFGRDLAPGMLHRHTAHNEAVARIGWCIAERRIGVITGQIRAECCVVVGVHGRAGGAIGCSGPDATSCCGVLWCRWEQGVLRQWQFDGQALALAAVGINGVELAAADPVQDSLFGHAESTGGVLEPDPSSGASEVILARSSSSMRIRHGPPGPCCSPRMKPLASHR